MTRCIVCRTAYAPEDAHGERLILQVGIAAQDRFVCSSCLLEIGGSADDLLHHVDALVIHTLRDHRIMRQLLPERM